ncbi:MAG: hypothetical protein LBQ35_00610, partial [Spirochaetaceae bacterium]|nr:hypothetical protein [Spirochaetaceae bacterium]
MKEGALLVVPAAGRGRGGGHLARSIALVRALRAEGREAWLRAPEPSSCKLPAEAPGVTGEPLAIPESEIPARPWSWIILDNFRTSPEDFARWSALAPLIGIDEGGPLRSRFDFLADLLPALPGVHPPNLSAPGLNPRPCRAKERPFAAPEGALRVLVSFGAEDPAGLTVPVALALAPDEERSGGGRAPCAGATSPLRGSGVSGYPQCGGAPPPNPPPRG